MYVTDLSPASTSSRLDARENEALSVSHIWLTEHVSVLPNR